MSYIGNKPYIAARTIQRFTNGVDFTAGTTTQLTLSQAPGATTFADILFDGIEQHHDQFAISGTTITFSSAIPLLVQVVEVKFNTNVALSVPSDNSVSTLKLVDGSVTTAKIATSNVTTGTIADGNVTAIKVGTDFKQVVQNESYTWCGTSGGTANAITLTPTPAITTYTLGQRFRFKATSANTGATTVAVSGLTAVAIQLDTAALVANDIEANRFYEVEYDGTQFQLNKIGRFNVFRDNQLTIKNSADATKLVQLSLSGLTTGTTRTLTVPDANITLAGIDKVQTFTKAQSGAVTALTDAATIAVDLSLSNNFSVTLGGNRTLGNPTNPTVGQSGMIIVTQDATGTRTLAYSSYYKFAGGIAPVLTTTANAVDYLSYYVETTTRILVTAGKDVK